ncbi:hypothetical protein [Rhodoplanes azumiensis]|uniref:TolA protein n=1 Tax=Rhodoplanes azumiensis TaxID=1897628 RepID=A0ABW5ARA9_9BRAD
MRLAFFAISVILHALVGVMAGLPGRGLADAPPPITVELVRPEEAPEPPKPDAPAPQQAETPAETPTRQAKAEPQPEPQKPAEPQKEPPQQAPQQPPEPTAAPERKPDPATGPKLASADPTRADPTGADPTRAVATAEPASTESDGEGSGSWFDSPLMNVSVGYQTTERKATLTEAEIAAFKAHLQACWQPPAALAGAPASLKVVLRVAFQPNGTLAGDPTLLAAPASAKGPVLMQTAMAALARCQATGVLPAGKYKEWKLLDLAFSPAGLTGLPKL